ncbi:2,3-diphosphoglycerate-dependent phosphoglycerate mutase [Ferrovum sp.]|uniref:2,3-diphosphoglycerate-dependent phosphoglycerate mutase n=1 Tax=Ferrovum sp. TaxID=2609467 RepID=UPI002603560E|nr:2,3-diphosphoglycerate-dependent phosphoglycerate mutase [Ferrovum sp.]
MKKLVLLRHGQSVWNLENRFTGWTDVELSPAGLLEAVEAGRLIKDAGLLPDIAYTSVLQRAIKTLWLGLEVCERMWIPTVPDWRLNERHYGALQGLDKAETAAKYGEQQVLIWRRSYDTAPPLLAETDPRSERRDPRYGDPDALKAMAGETLEDTVARVVPLWERVMAPMVQSGRQVLVVAHGNSLRALIKHLGRHTREEIMELNIPTGIPLIYELDDQGAVLDHYYLGDPAKVEALTLAVANQGRLQS